MEKINSENYYYKSTKELVQWCDEWCAGIQRDDALYDDILEELLLRRLPLGGMAE